MSRTCPSHPDSRRKPRAGFGLVEISVVFAAISVVLAFTLPLAKRRIVQMRADAVTHDLRTFAAAFQSSATQRGDWPPGNGTPAAIPPGMSNALKNTSWEKRTPIGGNYAWDIDSTHQGTHHRAVIVIASAPGNPVTSNRAQLLAIDRVIDDGNLTTGSFLLGYRNFPIYVLEH